VTISVEPGSFHIGCGGGGGRVAGKILLWVSQMIDKMT
jgi:hypothetical protein